MTTPPTLPQLTPSDLRQIIRGGAEAVKAIAKNHATSVKAVDQAMRSMRLNSASATVRSLAGSAIRHATRKVATETAVATGARVLQIGSRTIQLTSGVVTGVTIGFIILIGIGMWVLFGQVGDHAGDAPVKPGWRARLPEKRPDNPLADLVPDAGDAAKDPAGDDFRPGGVGPKGPAAGELWRTVWGGEQARVVSRVPGAILSFKVWETQQGTSGEVSYLDARGKPAKRPLKVAVSDDGMKLEFSYATASGGVSGKGRVDGDSGWLLGTAEMPAKLGGKIDLALIATR